MIGAKVIVKGSNRELGLWQFMHLPRAGEMLVVTVDDVPSSFSVAGVIHVPIVREELGVGKPPVPSTVVIVEEPQPVEKPE